MGKVKTGVHSLLPAAPIVLVGANVDGKPNYMATAFVNGVNIKPAIVYVSLNRKHHTPKGIIENHTFSINVPSADHVIETDYCGLVSGKNVEKSNIFTTFYGELETAPMIEEFPITCECRFTGQKVEFSMDIVYFGEVIQVYASEEILGADRKIDIQRANPIFYSGIERRYRSFGKDLGPAWSIGWQYKPKHNAMESQYRPDIVERAAQPALTIRTRISLVSLASTIGGSLLAVSQYAREKGYIPAGPPFVAYHSFDGQEGDVEIGLPFEPGIEGKESIKVSQIPGGKSAIYHHIGPYDKLPQVRAALELWLETNGQIKSGAIYEMYLNDPQTTTPDRLETEIIFPLL